MHFLRTIIKGFSILGQTEKKEGTLVLILVMLSAMVSGVMIASVMPFLMVLSSPEQISNSEFLNLLYHNFGFTSSYYFLISIGIGSLTIILFGSIIQITKLYALSHFTMMLVHSTSTQILSAKINQNYEDFTRQNTGEMSTLILSETTQIVDLFYRPATELISSLLAVLAVGTVLVLIDPIVAALSVITLAGAYIFTYIVTRKSVKRSGEERLKANHSRYKIVNEALGGIKDVITLGSQNYYVNAFHDPSRRMALSTITLSIMSQLPRFVVEFVAFGGLITICLVLIDKDSFLAGNALADIIPKLGAFALAGQRVIPELQKLYQAIVQIQYATPTVEKIYSELQFAKINRVEAPSRNLTSLKSYLALDNISFQYKTSSFSNLDKINIRIKAGQKVGIIGSTGAGKTTLADIILGLLSPTQGCLIVDGKPILDLTSWRKNIGYVPQNIFLADTTIAQNIALGVPVHEICDAKLMLAAKTAQLHDFIETQLPKRYETMVGERGVQLSGGQIQRIGIARSLYNGADLIVFDEATSALDNQTELELMAAIDALSGDKTIIVIAHRLQTVKNCDQIILMERGKVHAQGTWQELAKLNTNFQKLIG